jgi:acyl carrier protein
VIGPAPEGAKLPEIEKTADAETTVLETIRTLLGRRGAADIPLNAESKLTGDLGFDSLELAEVSAVLEDELGSDPFSEGILPETVGELIGFYSA